MAAYVYPAAGLVLDALGAKRKFIVNRELSLENLPLDRVGEFEDWQRFIGPATEGMLQVRDLLLERSNADAAARSSIDG